MRVSVGAAMRVATCISAHVERQKPATLAT